MEKVEKKIRDLKAIRILFIFDFAIITALLISFFHLGFLSPATFIFFPLLLICIILQLLLYFIPKGKVIFDSIGITIITKHEKEIIPWNRVKHIHYNSFSEIFPLLDHFTVDLLINTDEGIIDFNHKFGIIKTYEKEYLRIVSLIPQHILDDNNFMIYKICRKSKKD